MAKNGDVTAGRRPQRFLCAGAAMCFLLCSAGTRVAGEDDFVPMTATCCWPQQFQARLGRFNGLPVGGSPTIFEEEMLLFYDYPYKRWGFWIRENYVTNDYMELIYVEDYKEGKSTAGNIYGCVRVPLPSDTRMELPCLPPNARYVETSWLGNRTLPYDVWEWDVEEFLSGRNSEKTSARIQISISHDNCKPVSDIAWWTAQKFNYTAYIGFVSMHVGETDGRTDNPFEDLRRYYNCKDYDSRPKNPDIRFDTHAEEIYLLNRVHGKLSLESEEPPVPAFMSWSDERYLTLDEPTSED